MRIYIERKKMGNLALGLLLLFWLSCGVSPDKNKTEMEVFEEDVNIVEKWEILVEGLREEDHDLVMDGVGVESADEEVFLLHGEVHDIYEEINCIPVCEGKECGDDACGGSCGGCPEGEQCHDGKCLSYLLDPTILILKAEGLPYYISNPLFSPERAKMLLSEYGFSSEVVEAETLKEKVLDNKYKILIHLYGNTFPQDIKDALTLFHKKGGCIIATGVPFCHPSIAIGAKDWLLEMKQEGGSQRDTEVFHNGNASCRIEHHSLDGWHGATSQQYETKAFTTYEISGWVRTKGDKSKGDFLFVRFFDGNGKFLGQDGPEVPQSNSWVLVKKIVKAPEKAMVMDVSLQVWSAERTVWLDDVELKIQGGGGNLLSNPGFESPSSPWKDLGHTNAFFGHNSIGTGGYAGPSSKPTMVQRVKDDVLQLHKIDDYKFSPANAQWIEESTLPFEDKLVPIFDIYEKMGWIINQKLGTVIGFIEHNCKDFKGAIDMRLNYYALSGNPFDSAVLGEEILVRGVGYIALKKGLIGKSTFLKIINKSDVRLSELYKYQNINTVEEQKPFKGVFPKSQPPSKTVYVADVSQAYEELRLALVTLQGLVNREKPQIYLIFSKWDKFWLDYMKNEGHIEDIIEIAPEELFDIFKDKITCVVFPKQEIFEEPNLSVTVASVENCIVGNEGAPFMAKISNPGKWISLPDQVVDNASGLKYVYEKYKDKINHFLLASIYPKNKSTNTRDYFYQHKVFTFWITGEKDGVCKTCSPIDELKVMMKVFAELPVNIPVRGFYWAGDGVGLQEGPGVSLLSEFGKITVVSDGFANLSFHSGFYLENYKQKKIISEDKPVEKKIYVAITLSDGDNLNTLYNYFPDYVNDPLFGTFPVGFGMGPTIIDLAPLIGEWYYKQQKKNIEYITDVSGVGYIIPEVFGIRYKEKSKVFQGFISLTDEYMARADHHIVRPISGGKQEFEVYGKGIQTLIALFPDYGKTGDVKTYEDAVFKLSNGIPVFRASNRYENDFEGVIKDIQDLVGNQRPAFVNAFLCNWFWNMEKIKELIQKSPSDFVFVSPSELVKLFNKYDNQIKNNNNK